jgi:hypothetical protein
MRVGCDGVFSSGFPTEGLVRSVICWLAGESYAPLLVEHDGVGSRLYLPYAEVVVK